MFDKPWLARVLLLTQFPLVFFFLKKKNGFYHKGVGHWDPLEGKIHQRVTLVAWQPLVDVFTVNI